MIKVIKEVRIKKAKGDNYVPGKVPKFLGEMVSEQ